MRRFVPTLQDVSMMLSLFTKKVNRLVIVDKENTIQGIKANGMSHLADGSGLVILSENEEKEQDSFEYILDFTGKSEGTSYYYILSEEGKARVFFTENLRKMPMQHSFRIWNITLPGRVANWIFKMGWGHQLADGKITIRHSSATPFQQAFGIEQPQWIMNEERDGHAVILAHLGTHIGGETVARIITNANNVEWLRYQSAKRAQLDKKINQSAQLSSIDPSTQIMKLNYSENFISLLNALNVEQLQAGFTKQTSVYQNLNEKSKKDAPLRIRLERAFSEAQQNAIITTAWLPAHLASPSAQTPGNRMHMVQMPIFFPLFASLIPQHQDLHSFRMSIVQVMRKNNAMRKFWGFSNEIKRQLALFLLQEIESHPAMESTYMQWIEELHLQPKAIAPKVEMIKAMEGLRYAIVEETQGMPYHLHVVMYEQHAPVAIEQLQKNINLRMLRNNKGNGYQILEARSNSGERMSLRITTAVRYKDQELMDIIPLLRAVNTDRNGYLIPELRFRIEFEWMRFQFDANRGDEQLRKLIDSTDYFGKMKILNFFNSKYNTEFRSTDELCSKTEQKTLLHQLRKSRPANFSQRLQILFTEWTSGSLKMRWNPGFVVSTAQVVSPEQTKEWRRVLQREIIVKPAQQAKGFFASLSIRWAVMRGKVVILKTEKQLLPDPFAKDELKEHMLLKIA